MTFSGLFSKFSVSFLHYLSLVFPVLPFKGVVVGLAVGFKSLNQSTVTRVKLLDEFFKFCHIVDVHIVELYDDKAFDMPAFNRPLIFHRL